MMDILFLVLVEIEKIILLLKHLKKGKTEIIEKKVFKRKYKIQRIDGLPEKKSYSSQRSL